MYASVQHEKKHVTEHKLARKCEKKISNVKYMASPHGESYSHAVHLTMHSSLATDLQQRLAACKGASVAVSYTHLTLPTKRIV